MDRSLNIHLDKIGDKTFYYLHFGFWKRAILSLTVPRFGRELSTLLGLVLLGVEETEEMEGEGGWSLEEGEGVGGNSCICEIREGDRDTEVL